MLHWFLTAGGNLSSMVTKLWTSYRCFWPKICIPVLLISVTLGLILGTVFAISAGDPFLSLMRAAPSERMSIVPLAITLCLPFLFCVFAALLSAPWLLPLICFAKCIAFAFVSSGLLLAYGGGGWLVRLLLMFSQLWSLPLLIWFCLRHIRGNKQGICVNCAVLLAFLLLAMVAENYFISNILGQLRL